MSRLKNGGRQTARNHNRRGVWVPAFAGTTSGGRCSHRS